MDNVRKRGESIEAIRSSYTEKGLLILDALQEKNMTLREVIQTFSFNKSTAFRLLYTLEIMGYVKKIDNSYSLTKKMGFYLLPLTQKQIGYRFHLYMS